MNKNAKRPLRTYLVSAVSAVMVTFGGSLFVAGISMADTTVASGPITRSETPSNAARFTPSATADAPRFTPIAPADAPRFTPIAPADAPRFTPIAPATQTPARPPANNSAGEEHSSGDARSSR